jgi:hypothetical protein
MTRTLWLATVLGLLWTITCYSYLGADEVEKRAVRAIERVGGRLIRDEKAAGRPIITVFLNGTQMTDVGLKELAGLKQLKTLILSGTKVTDAGVAEFKAKRPGCHIHK